MDALQFGQWFSKRRRLYGWSSQRALIEIVRQKPTLNTLGISEDFLARLEAGHLQYPFRGSSRQRVLALAYLLCKTPREVRAYQRAAGLNDLKTEELELLANLTEQLSLPREPTHMLLPARPPRLVGRDAEADQLQRALCESDPGIYIITGMPGVGKSSLAAEIVHRLSSERSYYHRCFPDGIITLSGKGYQGQAGLNAILNKLLEIFDPTITPYAGEVNEAENEPRLDRVRTLLAGKRALLVLDDLDPHFPLRQALENLLVQGYRSHEVGHDASDLLTGFSLLITSRALPMTSKLSYHLQLTPLTEDASFELFTALLERPLTSSEAVAVVRICNAVGHLPLAIEFAVNAIKAGVACSLLADRLAIQALDPLLDSEGELQRLLKQALTALPLETQEQFLLISTLGKQAFSLEEAACKKVLLNDWEKEGAEVGLSAAQIAQTATQMTRLVRNSLVDLLVPVELAQVRYQLHPLLYMFGIQQQRARQSEALAFIQRNHHDIGQFKRQSHLLLGTLAQAWHTEQYELLIKLVYQLQNFIEQLPYSKGLKILDWGLEACAALHDPYHQAHLLNAKGKLCFYRGDFESAQWLWQSSLQIGQAIPLQSLTGNQRGELASVWENFASIADAQGDYAATQRYLNIYQRICQESGDLLGSAQAFKRQGYYAYQQGQRAEAERAFKNAETLYNGQAQTSPSAQPALHELRLWQAHLQKNQPPTTAHIEKLLESISSYQAPYYTPEFLLVEAELAYKQQRVNNVQLLVLRAIHEARKIEASFLIKKGLELLQKLPYGPHTVNEITSFDELITTSER